MKFHHVSPLSEKAVETNCSQQIYVTSNKRPRSLWEWDTQDSLPKQKKGTSWRNCLWNRRGSLLSGPLQKQDGISLFPHRLINSCEERKGLDLQPGWTGWSGSGVEGVPTHCLLQPVLSPDWTWRYLMRVTSFWQQATPGYANSLSWAARQWDEARTGPWTTCQGVPT